MRLNDLLHRGAILDGWAGSMNRSDMNQVVEKELTDESGIDLGTRQPW